MSCYEASKFEIVTGRREQAGRDDTDRLLVGCSKSRRMRRLFCMARHDPVGETLGRKDSKVV